MGPAQFGKELRDELRNAVIKSRIYHLKSNCKHAQCFSTCLGTGSNSASTTRPLAPSEQNETSGLLAKRSSSYFPAVLFFRAAEVPALGNFECRVLAIAFASSRFISTSC